jgi:CO dehydrogenase maturation factor
MKLAITGKGGVGKTTFTALFARLLKDKGNKVLLIDADPDMNLATVIGVPPEARKKPISELKELIAERTGVIPGAPAPLFKMNPKVDDIPDKYCTNYNDLKLILMGTIKKGGGGCACPEYAFLKNLLSYLMVARDEWVLLDMEAGIEHLGRGTAIGVDHMIVLVEPNLTSIETAFRIDKLSKDIGIKNLHVVGNKIQIPEEKIFIKDNVKSMNVLGFIDQSEVIKKISLNMISPMDIEPEDLIPIENIYEKLKNI